MLTSKALQNLANGVDFREDYMASMNENFLHKNIPVIRDWFAQISVRSNKHTSVTNINIREEHKQLNLMLLRNSLCK